MQSLRHKEYDLRYIIDVQYLGLDPLHVVDEVVLVDDLEGTLETLTDSQEVGNLIDLFFVQVVDLEAFDSGNKVLFEDLGRVTGESTCTMVILVQEKVVEGKVLVNKGCFNFGQDEVKLLDFGEFFFGEKL